jgi:membrane protein required for colicin V production
VEVGQITEIATVLLVSFLLLTMAGLYTFRYAKMPSSLDFLDRILGTLLWLVLGALFLGILAILLRDLFVLRNTAGSLTFPIMQAFQESVRLSFLVKFFGTNILALIYNLVRPVLPQGSEVIFQVP